MEHCVSCVCCPSTFGKGRLSLERLMRGTYLIWRWLRKNPTQSSGFSLCWPCFENGGAACCKSFVWATTVVKSPIYNTYAYIYIFKGCRPCRRPRKRETRNGVSWLHSSVLWVVSLDALYIHYIYMHQIVYTCVLNWNFASPYPCHEAQASILLLSVFRGWCVLLPVRET